MTKRSIFNPFLLEVLLVATLLTIGLFLRLYKLETRPGYEWDEPIYENIINNFSTQGYPAIKSEGGDTAPFLYHPPFDFALRSFVATHSRLPRDIFGGRVVSVIASVLTLLVLYLLVRQHADKRVAFTATFCVATDGWIIYTNRLLLIENIALLFGMLALLAYSLALRRAKPYLYVLAGILLGLAVIYKHTGIYLLAIPPLYELFTHRNWRRAALILTSAGMVIAVYVAAMIAVWGKLYLDQTLVQINRALGFTHARGLNYSIRDALRPIVDTYWIYFTTLATLLGGALVVATSALRSVFTKQPPIAPLLLAWSLASLFFLGGIALRAPQYLIIALLPLYVYLAVRLLPALLRNGWQNAVAFIAILLGLNSITWYLRFIAHDDNALAATREYFIEYVPHDAVVLTEESIGVSIPQTYYKFDTYATVADAKRVEADYIAIYESATERLPESAALQALLAKSQKLEQITGFKEKISIYKITVES